MVVPRFFLGGGRAIREESHLAAGFKSIMWNAGILSSGIYVYLFGPYLLWIYVHVIIGNFILLSIMDHNSQWLISLRLKPPAGEETHEVPNRKRWGKKGPCPILIKLLSREPFLAHQVLVSIRPSTPTWNSHATFSLLTWPSLRNRGTYHITFQTTSIVSNATNMDVSQSKVPPSFMGMIISCDEILITILRYSPPVSSRPKHLQQRWCISEHPDGSYSQAPVGLKPLQPRAEKRWQDSTSAAIRKGGKMKQWISCSNHFAILNYMSV